MDDNKNVYLQQKRLNNHLLSRYVQTLNYDIN